MLWRGVDAAKEDVKLREITWFIVVRREKGVWEGCVGRLDGMKRNEKGCGKE